MWWDLIQCMLLSCAILKMLGGCWRFSVKAVSKRCIFSDFIAVNLGLISNLKQIIQTSCQSIS